MHTQMSQHNCVTMAVAGPVYDKGRLAGSDKEWYHGELTRDKAEQSLKASSCDCLDPHSTLSRSPCLISHT